MKNWRLSKCKSNNIVIDQEPNTDLIRPSTSNSSNNNSSFPSNGIENIRNVSPSPIRRPQSLTEMLAAKSNINITNSNSNFNTNNPIPSVPRRGPPPIPMLHGPDSKNNVRNRPEINNNSNQYNHNYHHLVDSINIAKHATVNSNATASAGTSNMYSSDHMGTDIKNSIANLYREDMDIAEGNQSIAAATSTTSNSDITNGPLSTSLGDNSTTTTSNNMNKNEWLSILKSHLLSMSHSMEIIDNILRDVIEPSTINTTFDNIGMLRK